MLNEFLWSTTLDIFCTKIITSGRPGTLSLRTFHFRPYPFITRLELKGFQRRMGLSSHIPAAWVTACSGCGRPWHGAAGTRGCRHCWWGCPRWELSLHKCQVSERVFAVLWKECNSGFRRAVLLLIRMCGTRWGETSCCSELGMILPQRQSCSSPVLRLEQWWCSQQRSLSASQSCLNGIVSGAARRLLLGVLAPIKICIPVGIIGNLTRPVFWWGNPLISVLYVQQCPQHPGCFLTCWLLRLGCFRLCSSVWCTSESFSVVQQHSSAPCPAQLLLPALGCAGDCCGSGCGSRELCCGAGSVPYGYHWEGSAGPQSIFTKNPVFAHQETGQLQPASCCSIM